jgi:hypothetical protein
MVNFLCNFCWLHENSKCLIPYNQESIVLWQERIWERGLESLTVIQYENWECKNTETPKRQRKNQFTYFTTTLLQSLHLPQLICLYVPGSENSLNSSHRQSWKHMRNISRRRLQIRYIRIWSPRIKRQSYAQFSIEAKQRFVRTSKRLQPLNDVLSISSSNTICVTHAHRISDKCCSLLWFFITQQISARF